MKDLPSEEELFANRMKDGSRPPMHSKELYEKHVVDGFGRPLPEELRDKTPEELTAAELEFEADLMLLDDLDFCRDMGRYLANTGRAAMEMHQSPGRKAGASAPETNDNEEQSSTQETASSGASAPEGMGDLSDEALAKSEDTHATVAESDSHADTSRNTNPGRPAMSSSNGNAGGVTSDDPDPDRVRPLEPLRLRGPRKLPDGTVVPDGPTSEQTDQQYAKQQVKKAKLHERRERATTNSTKRAPDAALKNITKAQAGAMIHHGCKLVLSVAELRAEVFKRLIKHAMQQELKEAFYWDRAHAVIAATLLHLDKEFEEVGFGSWMPFRFPDQWLMFCGIMRRVLAANGLLHGTDPEQYRRLLEETPYPAPAIKNIDERIKWWKTPQNWSTLWTNRGAETMEILKQRLKDEVWDPTTQFGGTRAPPESP